MSGSDLVTITVSRKALYAAANALENLGDENPWTADEYDEPAQEIRDALKSAREAQ